LKLLNNPDVEYCHPEIVRTRAHKAIFAEQWHLKRTKIGDTTVSAHAHVEAAHELSQGEGITIAIVDDGVDIDHLEFAQANKIVGPRDATLQSDDPRPKFPKEAHGTACAGVACASGADGASGVAPKARLMPIRLSSDLGSKAEGDAFFWAAKKGADVISCSWGPRDGRWWDPNDPQHNVKVSLPVSTRLAIDYAVTKGRAGRGCVVLFAAGNGNELVENDGYASNPNVVAVAACNDRGKRSVYSDFGEAIVCCFPSNDLHWPQHNVPPLTPGIWTTDRVGAAGYNGSSSDRRGDYTNDFGGTSSACPGAAGIVALALSVNPELTQQQVRDLLGRASDRIDPTGGEYNGAGRSRFYGFGRLNAERAVTLALAAKTSTPAAPHVANAGPMAISNGELEYLLDHATDGEDRTTRTARDGQISKPKVDRFVATTHHESRMGSTVEYVVMHYTTSLNIEGTISHFKNGRIDPKTGKTIRTSAHYIVGRDGQLVQMVVDSEAAWHSGSSEINRRSIGIEHVAAAGDRITDRQTATSLALLRWLMRTYGVKQDKIVPHNSLKSTSCPGDLFAAHGSDPATALRSWLATNLGDGPDTTA